MQGGRTFGEPQDQVTVNPCHKVKKLLMDNARTRYLSIEEERLLEVMTGRLAHLGPIVIIAIDTGLRRGELLSLEREQVDFVLNVINVKRTKSGKGRTVPMTPRESEELKRLCENSDGRFRRCENRNASAARRPNESRNNGFGEHKRASIVGLIARHQTSHCSIGADHLTDGQQVLRLFAVLTAKGIVRWRKH
jgi:integrase